MRNVLKVTLCFLMLIARTGAANDHVENFLSTIAEDTRHAQARAAQPKATPRLEAVAQVQYEIVNGQATRTHGFEMRGEVWVQNGNNVTRLMAAADAVVVYEDGVVRSYADAQKSLQEWVRAYGPMSIQVHRFAGGTAFKQIRILPIK